MTEKRFVFNGCTNCIEYDGKSILLDSYGEEIEDLLNYLHEENIQLKKFYDTSEKVNDALSKENEELHQIQQELADENRLLKKEYSTMLDLVWKSGIDYVVCDELEDLE